MPPLLDLPVAMTGVGQPRLKESRWRRVFWAAFPHVCLILSVVLYSLLGALMFTQIEGSAHPRTEELEDFLGRLWNVSQDSCDSEGNSSLYLKQNFMQAATELMKHFKVEWNKNPQIQWSFLGSLFFCCTVFTTVGYGHISPVTDGGKFACIAYAGVGIPLMLLLLADLGDLLAAILSKCYGTVQKFCSRKGPGQPSSNLSKRFSSYRIAKRKDTTAKPEQVLPLNRQVVVFKEPLNITEVMKTKTLMKQKSAILRNKDIFEKIVAQQRLKLLTIHNLKLARCRSCPELDQIPQVQHAIEDFDKIGKELNKLNVPICLIAFIVVAYTLCGASILLIWEKDWNYVDAFYFCFITLTTIGFGDIFPNHPNYFLGLSVYTVIGMAIMVMAFKLGQDRLVGCYKQSISCISGGKARKYSNV
ncbi:potassium channel subfamily K member 18 [Ambystoma mexicanum]|uniref:potassium channel subfamily K member 18 n=1 Tax=Ambystoma mexicanum TaxID=8296 RepID=UPI0037E7D792